MLSGNSCHRCHNENNSNSNNLSMCSNCESRPLDVLSEKFTMDILIVKQNRKNLKSPTHFCRMCGYGDFSSTRVRRHLMLKHHPLLSKGMDEKPSILADRLSIRHSDSEPESPLSTKLCDDMPEDLSVHSDAVSDNDENVQVVPQFKPVIKVENKRSVIVRTPKKATKRPATPNTTSILKRRLLGEHVVDELEASEATLNANELNVKMVYQNSKFVIDKSESFWLKGYKLPSRYELAH